MAESQRRAAGAGAAIDDEAQKRKDRRFMIIFLISMLGLIALMILIAGFLSGEIGG